MSGQQRGHQRAHLRAPFRAWILFGDSEFVHRAHAQNISEGGLLLDEIPQYPAEEETPIMFSLPRFPYLKDFDVVRLRNLHSEMNEGVVLRGHCFISRRAGATSTVDEVFRPSVGLRFTNMPDDAKTLIAAYVATYQANLIYLQMLMDSWTTSEEIRLKARLIADLLGYENLTKVAQLRAQVNLDYRSLQWL